MGRKRNDENLAVRIISSESDFMSMECPGNSCLLNRSKISRRNILREGLVYIEKPIGNLHTSDDENIS
jgi:hypothetical protein